LPPRGVSWGSAAGGRYVGVQFGQCVRLIFAFHACVGVFRLLPFSSSKDILPIHCRKKIANSNPFVPDSLWFAA
jgi:hypothetical protein